jgi:hypothetical protein
MTDVVFFALAAFSFALAAFKVSAPFVDFYPLGFCLLLIGVVIG